jgi:hypothetical protein
LTRFSHKQIWKQSQSLLQRKWRICGVVISIAIFLMHSLCYYWEFVFTWLSRKRKYLLLTCRDAFQCLLTSQIASKGSFNNNLQILPIQRHILFMFIQWQNRSENTLWFFFIYFICFIEINRDKYKKETFIYFFDNFSNMFKSSYSYTIFIIK